MAGLRAHKRAEMQVASMAGLSVAKTVGMKGMIKVVEKAA